ncbi:probable splicing factor, arginine/serine-rich 6 [Patiria miniata]|uniref:RRM domain-containing protein n=1 Tax=Patiria miniata TaxID=46514 RepID=A0A914BK92_PATMI|nr:probable splicing factor, arginine/serine-rich 6 [Patiria miniata]
MLTEGRLYVGSLNPGTSKQDIESEFGRYGSLRDVWLARNPPGFAFIEYDSVADAEKAMRDLDGANILGSRIKVEPSKGHQRGGRGGRGGGMRGGGGDRRGGGMRGGSRGGSFRGSRGSRDGDSRGGRGPPSSYSSYGDYPARGGAGAYRDEPKARYSSDPYGSRYDSAAYRSRSPIRRRSPPPTRGRDFGSREYSTMSREYGSGRDYGAGAADYGTSARDYASPRSYAPRDSTRDFDREYRSPVASSGAGARYDRSDFDRYSRYDRAPATYNDRTRRSPLPRR